MKLNFLLAFCLIYQVSAQGAGDCALDVVTTPYSETEVLFTWNLGESCDTAIFNDTIVISSDEGNVDTDCETTLFESCDEVARTCSFIYNCYPLQPCTAYTFSATWPNTTEIGTINGRTLDSAPNPPENLVVTSTTDVTLVATWDPPTDPTCLGTYNYFYTDGTETSAELSTTEATITLPGLTTCATYTFFVWSASLNGDSESAMLNSSVGIIPPAPQNLVITPQGTSSLHLTWEAPDVSMYNCSIDGYQATCTATSATPADSGLITDVNFDAEGLTANTDYTCNVRAHDVDAGYGVAAVGQQKTNAANLLCSAAIWATLLCAILLSLFH